MKCPKCKSTNVNVQVIQTAGKGKTKRMGCLWGSGRLFLIVCTLGLWLVFGRKKSTTNIKFESQKIGVCQNCGHQFNL